jgi:hypothetical protein
MSRKDVRPLSAYTNRLKQDSLYVSSGDEGVQAPLETIEQSQADLALRLAKVSFNASDLLGRGFDAKRAGKTQVNLRTRYPMEND